MFEVDPKDVVRLNADQLTSLLRMLLYADAAKHGIAASYVEVSLKINVADGGEDGRISWSGGPASTDFLPRRLNGFQCKAVKKFDPVEAAEEILTKKGAVKPLVDEVLSADGAYIVFVSVELNTKQKSARVEAIRKKLKAKKKTYWKSADIRFYDAAQIAKWATSYVSTLLAVYSWAGKATVVGAKTWDEWDNVKRHGASKYERTPAIDGHLTQIKSIVGTPKKAIRILGLSGLGKTRLALEAFRPSESSPNPAGELSNRIAYVDAAGKVELSERVSDWQRSSPFGILVVDNCPLKLHQDLAREVSRAGSLLSLVTIDYTPDESFDQCPVIKLDVLPDGTIGAILNQGSTSLPEAESKQVITFSRGFPEIAVRLAEARIAKSIDLGRLNDDWMLERLLWGRRDKNQAGEEAVTAIALFEQVGFDGSVAAELEAVAKLICGCDSAALYKNLQPFVDQGIVEKHGHFLRLRLPPIAVELASRWWRRILPSRGNTIIEELSDRLAEAMCERMTHLDYLEEAKKFAGDLCGEQGSFGKAEVLNTERGSKIFRALAEVNPVAATNALTRSFGHLSIEEMKAVGPGRRNIVWALTKLVFRRETFLHASLVLIRLAAAENETWANNSTGNFLELFHVHLSGTEAPPKDRIELIDLALESDIRREREIGIQALGSALEAHHFTRTSGAERQGSGPDLKDWQPKYWHEVFDYWKSVLDRLFILAGDSDAEISRQAMSILAERVTGLCVSPEMVQHLDIGFSKILSARDGHWPALFASINRMLGWKRRELHADARAMLLRWRDRVAPENQNKAERLRMTVSQPAWGHYRESAGGQLKDIAEEETRKFAKVVAKNIEEWKECLPSVFRGEQRQGYAFGKSLGEQLKDPIVAIEIGLKELALTREAHPNTLVLGGILNSIAEGYPKLVADTLTAFETNRELQALYIDVLRFTKISEGNIQTALDLVQRGALPLSQLRNLAYGSVLVDFPENSIARIADAIASKNEEGCWIALDIMYMYLHSRPDPAPTVWTSIRKLVMSPHLGLTKSEFHGMDHYHWQDVVVKLLKKEDPELAENITKKVLAACKARRTVFEIPSEVIDALLDVNRASSWPLFSKALLSKDALISYQVASLLGNPYREKSSGGPLVKAMPLAELKQWCIDNPTAAPFELARMTPIFNSDEKVEWHPIARFLIDQYGDEADVLSNLDSNLGTYSWTGSIIPYYESQKSIFSSLKRHKKSKVRSWADRHVSWLEKSIEEEQKREADREMGVYH